jgi:tetratricopeptide (TPR) repeat protein
MLTTEGTAKLLDFGLAKLSDELALHEAAALPAAVRPTRGTASAETRADEPAGAGEPAAAQAVVAVGSPGPRPAGAANPLLWSQPPARALTVAGAILGTPAYMAPEAWTGETATARADIYSLGALLYELCCGHPPHDHETLEAICLAALETDAPPLAQVAPQVDARFAAIIERCLHRDPAARFASGQELQGALEALVAELTLPTAQTVLRRALRQRWPLALAAAALLVLPSLVLVYRFYQGRAAERRAAALVQRRRSLAIVGLPAVVGSAQDARFSAAFAELLGRELTIGEQFRRVPAESVTRMKLDLQLPAAERHPPRVLQRIRQYMDAELVVLGSYRPDPTAANRLRIGVNVQDTQSGALLATAQVSGSPSELFELVTRTGRELRQQLGVPEPSAAQTAALQAAKPASAEAALFYAEGRDKLRHFDAVGARRLLEKVIATDPDYPLGHLAMADVWTALGYDREAQQAIRRAFKLSATLPREDRYLIMARHRESLKEWDKAFAAYQTLLTFFPTSLDYGLYLGKAQLDAGQPEAALATAKKLRLLPGPASQDPRLDILEARAVSDRGDYPAALALLDSAVRKGEAIGSPLLVARARLEAAYVLSWMGQQERALTSAALARPLFLEAGDRGAAADTLIAMSSAHAYRGELDSALASAQEALTLLVEIENSSLAAASFCNMALLLTKKGELALAQSRAEGGLLLSKQIGLLESVGAGYVVTGLIAVLRGELPRAMQSYQAAAAAFKELGDPRMVAWVDSQVAQVLLLRGELAAARQKNEQALAIRQQHGLSGFAAESQAALAAIDLEEGLWPQAEAHARAAAAQFARDAQVDNEAWAQALRAQALAGQQQPEAAAQAMARASELGGRCQNRLIRLLVQRSAILLRLRQDPSSSAAAEQQLAPLLAEARAAGLLTEEYEIRAAQYLARLAQGRTPELVQQVRSFAQQASSRELGLLARRVRMTLN